MTNPHEIIGIALQIDLDGAPHIRVAARTEPEPTDEEITEAQEDDERLWGVPWKDQ